MVHRYRTGREPTCLEEVLDEPVAGKDMSVKAGQPSLAKLVEREVEHRFADSYLTSRMIDENQAD
jgi:hypothetical protein